jgi:hypothetical protein
MVMTKTRHTVAAPGAAPMAPLAGGCRSTSAVSECATDIALVTLDERDPHMRIVACVEGTTRRDLSVSRFDP